MNFLIRKTVLFVLMILSSVAYAQVTDYSSGGEGVAFDGHDLTEYFNNKAVRGKQDFQYKHDDIVLLFTSEANRKKFIENPEKYLPAYKGWCATAVANGALYKPDYTQFKIQEDKLLFFEVRAFFNGKTAWNKNPELNMILADKKFKEIKK